MILDEQRTNEGGNRSARTTTTGGRADTDAVATAGEAP